MLGYYKDAIDGKIFHSVDICVHLSFKSRMGELDTMIIL